MLASLSIKNYALIEKLQVDFTQGFTIITGETGAGKSILLGGLSLILGKRADLSAIKNPEQKCIIEAVFNIAPLGLQAFFESEALDYDPQTIIRREILPSGKSRAFINDSPVTLNSLQALASKLIDIHSQHETLQLVTNEFQFKVIDALANNTKNLITYQEALKAYKALKKTLEAKVKNKAEAIKEHDYNVFLLNELEEANLVPGELQALEEEYETLNNIEAIQEKLLHSHQLLDNEQLSILSMLNELKNNFQVLARFSERYKTESDRIQSVVIEIDDIFSEIETLQAGLETDPNRLQLVGDKLERIHALMKKHLVDDVEGLIALKNQLAKTVSQTEHLDTDIEALQAQINLQETALNQTAAAIKKQREQAIPNLTAQLQELLTQLGMPNAQFKVQLEPTNEFLPNGKDVLSFLFTANKGMPFNELKKAASGGELSRIMLSIKYVLSKYIQLPSIMFDEIDTGVSGEVSNKMAEIMLAMSQNMQVFAITHLPQVAAKGHTHFKVFKDNDKAVATTNLHKLNHDQRIVEIAQMLGGVEISNSAMAHAKQLLN
ncbi:DNA recombination protein RecN [Mangrovimonas yunxiaonensis]|uniref:DNA repair protein RecN n=1 Tax=Mangrovimonas yunxiaonensis TaxID=1197477 RepID=A0A084TN56_9FLAO|nr:DNA repair protein RecN [Mangrovimonas yunxiaonensis]KFB02142.1 DNA recombination protein RecN [Mangrovimonas yunxiaonensis]GGH47685.1 DNA repair protein RecN [Mangrovimonas yunxiaonensis]